mmetsp:Transcript_14254/g.25197  ORF Transcript_14254/g.25197 Transcript_14254/m.25197 type:complete len:114 (-) Transcript_14254:118-459(-)
MNVMELWKMLKAGDMDFVGQKQAYDMQFYLIWVAGVIGFIYGFIMQKFLYTFYFVFGATLFCAAVCFPAWPWWNRNPLNWLEPKEEPKPPEKEKKEAKKSKEGKSSGKKDKEK